MFSTLPTTALLGIQKFPELEPKNPKTKMPITKEILLLQEKENTENASTPLYEKTISMISKTAFPQIHKEKYESDEEPYIITSEEGQTEALQKISQYPLKPKGIFLGFALEFNYHLLALRPTNMALICDINARMHNLYNFIAQTIVVENMNRQKFLLSLKNELETNKEYYFSTEDINIDNVIKHYSEKEFSWLFSDEKFLKVQNLYLDGKIKHLNLDLEKDKQFFVSLEEWMKQENYTLDVVYVSNIPEWFQTLGNGRIDKMKRNLLNVMDSNTIFVDAKKKDSSGSPIVRVSINIDNEKGFPSFEAERRKKTKSLNPFLSGSHLLEIKRLKSFPIL